MPPLFFCDAKNCKPLHVVEYLRSFPQRGSQFAESRFSLEFYQLRDCLALGSNSQVLAPVHGHVLPCVFSESGPYLANEVALAGLAERTLATERACIEIPLAVPLYPAGAFNLWHWTFESLPKLLLLEFMGYTGPYIIPLQSTVVQASLDIFGIDETRRLPAGPLYRVENMIVPPQLSGYVLPENLPLVSFLREKILEKIGVLPGKKRCYIRRVGRRRIVNEAPMLEILKEFGFETMVPEEKGLADQWRYMTNVECSIMAHGANTTLTLVQPHHSCFIECFSNRYVNYSNMQSIRLLKMRYLPLVEELDSSWHLDKHEMSVREYIEGGISADIEVQLVHLRMHLEALLSETDR